MSKYLETAIIEFGSRMTAWVVILCLALLTGCDESVNINGTEIECVGVGDDKDPKYVYRVDKSNVFVGLILSETVIVPVVVAFDQLWCPVREA